MRDKETVKKINRLQTKLYHDRKRAEKLLANGRCPRCHILLDPQYQKFHTDCSFAKKIHLGIDLIE